MSTRGENGLHQAQDFELTDDQARVLYELKAIAQLVNQMYALIKWLINSVI